MNESKWLVAEIPGSVVISKGAEQSTGFGGSCLSALRIDREKLKLTDQK